MFKKIDDIIGRAVSSFQESLFYSKIADSFEGLDDDLRKVLGSWGGVLFILFPFVICLYFLMTNLSKSSDVEIKKKILKSASSFIGGQKKC